MKKCRFFVLMATLIALIMTFNSCSGNISASPSYDVVLNKEYVPQKNNDRKVEKIDGLNGYQFLEAKGEFMTFANVDTEKGIEKIVFSTRNKKIVYTANSTESESVDIKLLSNAPAFSVVRTQLTASDESSTLKSVSELYDATGTLVTQTKGDSLALIAFADTFLCNGSSYSIDESNGKFSKIADIPENLFMETCSDWNDKYFYTYGDSINVYGREFDHVYNWTVPSWANVMSQNMLDNGNILVQYTKPLDVNTDEYDIYEMDSDTGETKKFSLHTVILDPAKRTEKEIKFDYVVNQITTGTELLRTSENNGMYRDNIENIAYIYPIKDGQVDSSDASADIVLMSNNGKLKKSLKIIDDQRAALPTCIGNNIYIVSTVYGSALVDIDGNIIKQINNTTVSTVGDNIVSDGMIYTLTMDEVYSLNDNDAGVITYLNGTVFLKKGSDKEYSVIAINGTQEKEICKYSESEGSKIYFDELEDVGCYAVCNVSKGEYLYYNSEHELLYTSSLRLDKVASDYKNGVSLYCTVYESDITYFVIY